MISFFLMILLCAQFGILLNHSAAEYFEKLTFKKDKKPNFKRYLKNQDELRGVKRGRRFRPLQSPALLTSAYGVQRINDKPGKILNLLFFAYIFWKWAETFEKLKFFTFVQKQCFYLMHSAVANFETLTFQNKVIFCELYSRGYTAVPDYIISNKSFLSINFLVFWITRIFVQVMVRDVFRTRSNLYY